MSAAVFTAEEKVAIFETLSRIELRLNEAFAPRIEPGVILPEKARRALAARESAKLLGYFTVPLFAAVIGRSPHWVSDRCKAGVIKILPGGKPYRIPLTEEAQFNALDT